jgi:hypothetical protein
MLYFYQEGGALSKKTQILLLAGLMLFLFSGASQAVEVVRLDKTKIRLSIPLGQTKVGVINVENPSEEPKTVRVYFEDWYYLAPYDGSKDFKPRATTRLSCADWIDFSPAEILLPPYGKQKINYTVKVPQGVEGGHYAVLFFESLLGQPEAEGVGVSVAVRVATLFYIEAEGTLKKDVSLEKFSVQRNSKEAPLKIGFNLKNNGNVDITASGNYNIMDKKGMVYARGDFNTVYTFPGDSAELSATWSLPISKGTYDLILTLDLGKAQEEANLGRGPVFVKETSIEIGDNGEIIKAGELK